MKANRSVSQEKTPKVDSLYAMKQCIETCDLSNIVADDIKEASSDVCLRKGSFLPRSKLDCFAKAGGDQVGREAKKGESEP